jgi:hypothetical protein
LIFSSIKWIRRRVKMDSDFSKAKIGDWAWTINAGWCRITRVDPSDSLPLRIDGSGWYSIEGKFLPTDKVPSVFLIPPSDFNAGSPPCEFEEGDRVLVWNDEKDKWRARFSHYEESDDNKYHCYSKGDSWTSYGDTVGWKYCKRGEEK